MAARTACSSVEPRPHTDQQFNYMCNKSGGRAAPRHAAPRSRSRLDFPLCHSFIPAGPLQRQRQRHDRLQLPAACSWHGAPGNGSVHPEPRVRPIPPWSVVCPLSLRGVPTDDRGPLEQYSTRPAAPGPAHATLLACCWRAAGFKSLCCLLVPHC